MVSDQVIQDLAKQLFVCFERGEAIPPLSERYPELTISDAYQIQRALITHHRAKGRTVVGQKVGATSKEVQRWAGVDQPDYGVLFDQFTFAEGTVLSRSGQRMVSPRIEAELGFLLKKDIQGPGVTAMQLLGCIEAVFPVFEIVDSRIRDWQIKITDTIADNSSSWGVVLSQQARSPLGLDLSTVGMVLERDGEIVRMGVGAAVLEHPLRSAVWLVNTLGAFDQPLRAGELLLTGSLAAVADAMPGRWRARFSDGLGAVEFVLTE